MWIIMILIILQIPFIFLISSFKSTAFSMDFYRQEFNIYKPDVNNSIEVTQDLIYYLENKKADESYIQRFEDDEISHLSDVKVLMQKFILALNILLSISFILLVIFFFLDKHKILKNISIITLSGGILTSILILIFRYLLINFNSTFIRFHKIFFKTGTWTFPENSLLIRLFPQIFWIDAAYNMIYNTLIVSIILIIIGVVLFFISKKH